MPKMVNKRVYRFISLMEEAFMTQYYQQRGGFTRNKGGTISDPALSV
jgi:hypothetical protein